MPTPHTRASGRASIAAVGLVTAQLVVLASIDTRYLIVGACVLVLISAFAAFKLCRDNCVESRLATASVAAASVLGITLSSTVGLPGVSRQPLDVPGTALLLGALLVLLAITTEARGRRAVARPGATYAL